MERNGENASQGESRLRFVVRLDVIAVAVKQKFSDVYRSEFARPPRSEPNQRPSQAQGEANILK